MYGLVSYLIFVLSPCTTNWPFPLSRWPTGTRDCSQTWGGSLPDWYELWHRYRFCL